MEKLFFFDETFYWSRSGKRATVIEAECELTQSVRPEELRAAVLSALRVHRNFRARPVIVGRRFLVDTSEVEQVTVVSEDDQPRNLIKDTEGLMLYASYGESRFTLHVFHGLGDMRSICAFLHTVLSFYCHTNDNSQLAADSMDTFPCHEHILEGGAPGEPEGKYIPQEHDIFHLPEKLFSTRSTRQRIIDIDLPLKPVLAFARENGSSVVPALNAVIGRAIHQCYDVGQKEIVCYVPTDLRPVFHFESGGNGAIPFSLPYTAETDSLDFTTASKASTGEESTTLCPATICAGSRSRYWSNALWVSINGAGVSVVRTIKGTGFTLCSCAAEVLKEYFSYARILFNCRFRFVRCILCLFREEGWETLPGNRTAVSFGWQPLL